MHGCVCSVEADENRGFYKLYRLDKKPKRVRDEPGSTGEFNSPWHTIGSIIKYFRFTWDQAVWEIGYTNLIMLMATIPVFDPDGEGEEKKKEVKTEVVDFGNDIQALANFLNNQK